MKTLRATLGLAAVLTFFSTSFVGIAQANHVGCGAVITQDTTLDTDVGPCTTAGIRIAASNVTFDLGGHTIRGTGRRSPSVAGILLDGVSGVTVRNGTVTAFDAGVVIDEGSNNVIQRVRAVNNIGGIQFGDGIFCFQSDGNQIVDNQVVGNGPFSGITLDDCSNNLVDGNGVQNNVNGTAIGIWVLNDADIPLGPGVDPDTAGRQATNNVVSNNQVQGNALDGIQLARFTPGNIVRKNNASQNGTFRTNPVRDGNGIAIFGNANSVEDNITFGNGANGIVIFASTSTRTGRQQGVNNTLLRNRASGNDVGPNATQSFDFLDQYPNCDNNRWRQNRGVRASPPCTLTP